MPDVVALDSYAPEITPPEVAVLMTGVEHLEQKATGTLGEVVKLATELDPRFVLDHAFVQEVLQLTHEFFLPNEFTITYLMQEAKELAGKLSSVKGFKAAFFTGFPFYAVDPDQKPIKVSEIGLFIEAIRHSANEDAVQNPEG